MTDAIIELHAIVHGDVQGVGFRYTALSYAKQLNVQGTVCNRKDGCVELVAQGSKLKLEELLELLKNRFSIEMIETSFYSPVQFHDTFQIISKEV